MTVIRVLLRGSLVVIGVEFLLFGGLMALVFALWLLGLTTIDDQSRPPTSEDTYLAFHLLMMSLALAGLGYKCVCRLPHELCLTYDPSRDAVRTTLRGRLKRWLASDGPDDRDAAVLRLRLTRGAIPVSHLHEIERFIEEVRAMDPGVPVEDRRPTAAEPIG